ncbi:SDR family NAD(P)-dependent oxidoreductase, partial [Acinetobacter baumannii]|nr:SDR family NAD(P)-dependent oxidoreductase [Acinetobacter baumannii]
MAKLDTLQNKVVWVTGASSGLGKALAGEFALQGAQVILTSRRFEELEEV